MAIEPLINPLAKTLKRNPNDLRKAIAEGEKVVGSGVNNISDAKKILEKQGIPPEFLDKLIKNSHMATPYLSKLGISEKTLKEGLESLKTTEVSGGSGRADPNLKAQTSSPAFDKSKYRKV